METCEKLELIEIEFIEISDAFNALSRKMDGKNWTFVQLRNKRDFGKWEELCDATEEQLEATIDWHFKRSAIATERFRKTGSKKSVNSAASHLLRAVKLREKLSDLREVVA